MTVPSLTLSLSDSSGHVLCLSPPAQATLAHQAFMGEASLRNPSTAFLRAETEAHL